MITADREFHSIFLSHWLKKYQKLDVYFVFRQKKSTMIKRGKKYCKLSELKVNVGETKLLLNQKITKILKVKPIIYSCIKTEISSKICSR